MDEHEGAAAIATPDSGSGADATQATPAQEPWTGLVASQGQTAPAAPGPSPRLALGTSQVGRAVRSMQASCRTLDLDARTIELTFSSDEPILRWGSYEILDHSPGSVRLDRINAGGAVLVDHWSDQIGVVERAWIEQGRGHAKLRFSRNPRASEVWQDLIDGIRRNVSFAYWVHKVVLEEAGDEQPSTYRIVDWEPLEISIVAIPADVSIGVGRTAQEQTVICRVLSQQQYLEERSRDGGGPGEIPPPPPPPAPPAPPPEDGARAEQRSAQMDEKKRDGAGGATVVIEDTSRVRSEELARIRTIEQIVTNHESQIPGLREVGRQHINDGKSLDEFRTFVLSKLERQQPIIEGVREDRNLGLSEREVQRFSVMRLIDAIANPGDRTAQEAAAYELDVSDAYVKRAGRKQPTNGRSVPPDVLRARRLHTPEQIREAFREGGPVQYAPWKRDITSTGGATHGVELIQRQYMSMIEFLENRSILFQLANVLRDVTGIVTFPRQSSSPAAGFTASETGATGELDPLFDTLELNPKTAGGFVDLSARWVKQATPDGEALIQRWLGTKIGLACDLAGFTGDAGAGHVRGLINWAGIGSVTMGAPPVWANIVEFETDVSDANADIGSMAYVTSATGRGKLKSTAKDSGPTGKYLWEKNECGDYPGFVTNQIPKNLGGGTNETLLIFGVWMEFILALWGGLDLIVDPAKFFENNIIRVMGRQEFDCGPTHLGAFSVGQFIR